MIRLGLFQLIASLAALGAMTFAIVSPAAAVERDAVLEAILEDGLFVEEGATIGDQATVEAAIVKAAGDNISLYVVVLADDGSGIRAGDLVSDLQGSETVMVFTPDIYDFESTDICTERFHEARARADGPITSANPDIAVSAFVDEVIQLSSDGCAEGAGSATDSDSGSGLGWGTWLLVVCAALVLGFTVWLFAKSRASAARKARDEAAFADRRKILGDWASTLRAPITELQSAVAGTGSNTLATMYNDALKVARESDAALKSASSLPDLDRVEIRVARAHMQIRDVRSALASGKVPRP